MVGRGVWEWGRRGLPEALLLTLERERGRDSSLSMTTSAAKPGQQHEYGHIYIYIYIIKKEREREGYSLFDSQAQSSGYRFGSNNPSNPNNPI